MSTAKVPEQKKLLPFQDENVASNQQRIPLPYVRGTNLVAVRWVSPAINRVVHQVPGTGKKG